MPTEQDRQSSSEVDFFHQINTIQDILNPMSQTERAITINRLLETPLGQMIIEHLIKPNEQVATFVKQLIDDLHEQRRGIMEGTLLEATLRSFLNIAAV